MKYTEKVQIYNKFTKHYTRPMLQTDEHIISFSPYTQTSQHVNMEDHKKTCPSFHATSVVCITLLAQQISDKRKMMFPVQATIPIKKDQKKTENTVQIKLFHFTLMSF